MAEIEKVRKILLELAHDLVDKGVDSIGMAGQISFFKARFGKCNITVPRADVQALGLNEGDLVHVVVCKIEVETPYGSQNLMDHLGPNEKKTKSEKRFRREAIDRIGVHVRGIVKDLEQLRDKELKERPVARAVFELVKSINPKVGQHREEAPSYIG